MTTTNPTNTPEPNGEGDNCTTGVTAPGSPITSNSSPELSSAPEIADYVSKLPVTNVTIDGEITDLIIPEGWKFHLLYLEDRKELIFHGVMSWWDKQTAKNFSQNSSYKEAIENIYKRSRKSLLSMSIEQSPDVRVTTVTLPDAPAGDMEPEYWGGRLKYDANSKSLKMFGVMGRSRKLWAKYQWRKKDHFFRRAIDNLSWESSYFLSNGEAFIWVFRWVLLLLAAKLFERVADGMYEVLKAHGSVDFFLSLLPQSTQVTLNNFNKWFADWGIGIDEIQLGYFIGFLQFTVTLLLLIRYFTCLIDPIWRAVGISKHTDFSKGAWKERLKNTKLWTIIYVGLITSVEFFLLYHSAKAVSDISHWLHYLFLLVLADIFLFFVPNILKSLYHVIRLIPIGIRDVRMHWWYKRGKKLGDNTEWREAVKKIYEANRAVTTEKRTTILKKLGSIWVDYFFWDVFDLFSICAGLCVLRTHAGDEGKLLACLTVAGLTLIISALNFFINRDVYHTHISVLKLAKQ
jgi:hypothetical protein